MKNKLVIFLYACRAEILASVSAILGLIVAILLLTGCGSPSSDCEIKANLLYSGTPYGGLIDVMDKVNACMGTNTVPHVEIYETDFYDYTYREDINETGCFLVHGSAGKGTVVRLAKPSLESSKGQLFAEEFTHHLGVKGHEHPCQKINWEKI